MKKLYFTILSLLFALGFNAQTITAANFEPLNGEQFATYQIDSTQVSVGPNSPTVNWVFNTITTHSSLVSNYTTSIGTWSTFPSASVVVTAGNTNSSYYSSSATDLKYWGGNLQVGPVTTELKLTTPQFYMPYPTTLNGGTICPIQGSVFVAGNPGTFTGVATVTALATGTMALPLKTFTDVIRVTNIITGSFVVGGFPGTVTRNNYDFYSLSNSKYPILSISESTITGIGGSIQKFAYIQKNYQTVGLNNEAQQELTSLDVYPNPSSTTVNFVTNNANAKSVVIYDITGKMIETQLLNTGKLNLNVNNYKNGVYIYKLTNSNNEPIKTGKLTVNH